MKITTPKQTGLAAVLSLEPLTKPITVTLSVAKGLVLLVSMRFFAALRMTKVEHRQFC